MARSKLKLSQSLQDQPFPYGKFVKTLKMHRDDDYDSTENGSNKLNSNEFQKLLSQLPNTTVINLERSAHDSYYMNLSSDPQLSYLDRVEKIMPNDE